MAKNLEKRLELDKMISMGWKFLRILKDTKIAVDQEWQNNPITDREQLWEIMESDRYDLAINCGLSNITAVDVDVKNGKHGRQELEQLEAQYQELPPTRIHSTPSGGLHYIFEGLTAHGNKKLSEAIDVRAKGGYIVAPTSTGYEVLRDADVGFLPYWIERQQESRSKDEGPVNLEDKEFNQGDRNNELTRIAGSLRGMGLPADFVLDNLLEINAQMCNPPLETEEVELIARSIGSKPTEEAKAVARKKRRELKRQREFSEYKKEQGKNMPVPAIDLTGIPKKRVWIFNDWIPQGQIGSLYGSGGTGKSLVALQMGYAIATGTPWLGLESEVQMPVLMVSCEDDLDEMHRRIDAIRKPGVTGEDQLLLWPRVGEDNVLVTEKNGVLEKSLFFDLLEEYIALMPKGPKFLLLDTLADIYLANENDRMMANIFIKYHLGQLAKKYDLTILFIAHPSRAGVKSKDLLSGTTGWENSVRFRLTFSAHEDFDDVMILRRDKSNYSRRGEEIHATWKAGAFGVVEGTGAATPVDDELLDMIDSVTSDTILFTDFYDLVKEKGYRRVKKTLLRRVQKALSAKIERNGKTYWVKRDDVPCSDGKYRALQVVIEIEGHEGQNKTEPLEDLDLLE